MRPIVLHMALGAALGFAGSDASAAPVTSDGLLAAQDNAAEWLMYGRDYRNQRFSPLAQITPDNVAQLRPVWGLNASPISYELNGTQYIAMLSGLGGDPSFYFHGPKGGMLWVFALENQSVEPAAGGNPVPIEGALPTFER